MAKVYFTPKFTPERVRKLLEKLPLSDTVKKNELVALKIHFGEKFNKGYVKPRFAKTVAEAVREIGAKPFLTDANTIYKGARANAVEHTLVAHEHGFDIKNCPIVIADGLRGNSYVDVEINQKIFKKVKIASAVHYADSFVFITHFKGHELSGFGGALKNAGMGCGARAGKYEMHSIVKPRISEAKCIGCGVCIKWCPANAIKLLNKKAVIDYNKCTGCGECILSCEQKAAGIPWDQAESYKSLQERMIEYAYGVLKGKKAVYINFINHVTKFCDCYRTMEGPLIKNVGIVASTDPVAVDKASVDLVNQKAGYDLFKKVHPGLDWNIQLEYAEQLGMGKREYELERI